MNEEDPEEEEEEEEEEENLFKADAVGHGLAHVLHAARYSRTYSRARRPFKP